MLSHEFKFAEAHSNVCVYLYRAICSTKELSAIWNLYYHFKNVMFLKGRKSKFLWTVANLGAFLKKRRCCNLSQHLQLPFKLHSRHKYTSLFVYIYTLNAKKTINNSYINFKVVFPAQISESFFGIVFALQILKSFLPRKLGIVFLCRVLRSFLRWALRLTIRVLTLFVNRVTTCDTNSPMYWSFRTLCHAQFWTL